MKKSILLLTVILLSALTVVMAKTYYVEKAFCVKVKGQKTLLQSGTTLDANTHITVMQDGVLVFVDKETGKRWMVKKKFSGKIKKLAKPVEKDVVTVTKSYFHSMTKPVLKTSSEMGAVLGSVMAPGVGVGVPPEETLENDSTYKMDLSVAATPDSITFYVVE